jgi:hypothetical protein
MKSRTFLMALGAMIVGCAAASAQAQVPNSSSGPDSAASGTGEQRLVLTPEQRLAIYREVGRDSSKTAAKEFSPVVGADVPPMIELYSLPDDTAAEVPAVKLYRYTLVQNKVVLVDPIRMRVIDVIGPAAGR